jgi:hypothetical protein
MSMLGMLSEWLERCLKTFLDPACIWMFRLRVHLVKKIVYTSRFVRVILAQGPC